MDNYDEPKKSGTALKVVLIIITVIAVVAAAAFGLLYYNATTTIGRVRERNDALSQTIDEQKAQISEYEKTVAEYETQIADLTAQLEEAQNAIQAPEVDEPAEQTKPVIDLSGNTDLSVKPSELYDEGVEYTVDVAGLNMRSGPNTTYKIITSVALNSTVTAYAEDGEWVLVPTEGNTCGWVKSTFVTKK